MFHPTVFDNIRTVLEGHVYDQDLGGNLTVTDRHDVMDLATFQRYFHIEFTLPVEAVQTNPIRGQIQLSTSLRDIASEQLEVELTDQIGCHICVHFWLTVERVPEDTELIIHLLNEIWGNRPHIRQFLGIPIDEHRSQQWPPRSFENQITLDFHRKIDEGNIGDLENLVEHCFISLLRLQSNFVGQGER
ncbi:hypothetical protein [Brevibacillus dissolubilis]|uniref:hypothetical protein n=1 Tax=Brevibacillus dissolubilis TaxID=1844116 RepID=UPI001116BA18|nr:hypothetical protein [Brevibacillus dissolubilis]